MGIELEDGRRDHVSLPKLLELMSQRTELEMTALQAHQRLAWHSFLCQLAAIALHRGGESPEKLRLARSEEEWRQLLIGAAEVDGAGESAFELVVDDLEKPAFLQAPLGKEGLKGLNNRHAYPTGELDTLITAKNHDVKINRLSHPSPENWVFALVAIQTTEGFLGAGNYGIARMNGGFSSRPGVAFSSGLGTAERFCRDVPVLLAMALDPPALFEGTDRKSEALLWSKYWDGVTSAPLPSLHPLFIEICRRLRLVQNTDGSLVMHRGTSKAARVDGKALNGNTGDPWTPVEKEKSAALTLSEQGFNYRKLYQLLFTGEWSQGSAGQLRDTDGEAPYLIAQALVRGQGKTGGWHERAVPVPGRARRLFFDPEAKAWFGDRAGRWMGVVKVAQNTVLKPALLALFQGGPTTINFTDGRPEKILLEFDGAVDRGFFQRLFALAEYDDQVADNAWCQWLYDLAREQLTSAIDSTPQSAARRYRAEAKALEIFGKTAAKHLGIRSSAKPTTAVAEEAS